MAEDSKSQETPSPENVDVRESASATERSTDPEGSSPAQKESTDSTQAAQNEGIRQKQPVRGTQTLEPVRVIREGGIVGEKGAGQVQPFDFGASSFLTQRELRQMRELLEGFVNDLAARLSLFLRIEIDLTLGQVAASTVRGAMDHMNSSTHLTLLRMSPLRGHTVVETPLDISLTIVNRLLGGGVQISESPRRLNEVEISLMDDVISIIGSEWANLWCDFKDIQSSIVGHETNPQYLRVCPSSPLQSPAAGV